MSQNFCLIYYYIPQDLDDPENPNGYGIPVAKENVTLRDIKKSFPLEGKYIYRFKYKVQQQIVWMDLNSDDAKVPLFNNRIFIKATRLDWKAEHKMGDLNTKVQNFENNQQANNLQIPQPQMHSYSAQNLSISKESPLRKDKQEVQVPQNNNDNLLDF